MAKIAINGFGRIGRSFFRAAYRNPDLEIVAINDLAEVDSLKYLLKYDSVYGRFDKEIEGVDFLAEKDPTNLPWEKMGVDVVIESSGFFTDGAKAKAHLDAGAKKVVITAPASGDVTTALIGVNDDLFEEAGPITANASCTTNSVAPVMKILLKNFGIKKATMTTVHSYTATQKLVDGPDEKDPRRRRRAAANIVPSTTGAAEAVIQAIPELEGKFNAESIRVPTITGSLSIISALIDKKASVESINKVFEKASKEEKWSKVFKTTYDPIVSTDIIGEPFGAIIDLSLTKVLDADFVKVFSWYDNEAGYTATLVEHIRRVMKNL